MMLATHLPLPPRLEDGELSLRPFARDDAAALIAICASDPDIMRWVMRPDPFTEGSAHAWLEERDRRVDEGREVSWAITLLTTEELVGAIWLGRFDWMARRAEFGYWVAGQSRRRGIATRCVTLVSNWAFEALQLHRVQILVPLGNVASLGVAEKAGFTREGILRAYRRIAGEQTDLVAFARLPDDPLPIHR